MTEIAKFHTQKSFFHQIVEEASSFNRLCIVYSETATVNKQANSVQPTGTAASSLSLPGRPAQRVQKSTYVRDLRRRDAKIQELR